MTFVPENDREKMLLDALRLATAGRHNVPSPENYSVFCRVYGKEWDEVERGLCRDEAIGFARGVDSHSGPVVVHYEVRCGCFVVWPNDSWGETRP